MSRFSALLFITIQSFLSSALAQNGITLTPPQRSGYQGMVEWMQDTLDFLTDPVSVFISVVLLFAAFIALYLDPRSAFIATVLKVAVIVLVLLNIAAFLPSLRF